MRLRNRDLHAIEITLVVPRIFRLRLWLGVRLMVLGGRIAGITTVVTDAEAKEPQK
jgi:hypothetical protein